MSLECKSKTEDDTTKIKDEIDFEVATTGRGLMVAVKYEQEIEVDLEEDNSDGEMDQEDDSTNDEDVTNEKKTEDEEEGEKEGKEEGEERKLQEAEQETENRFEVYFDSIVEYVKTDASSGKGEAYDWENDQIVQEMDLSTWSDITPVSVNGETATFQVSDPENKVTFSFTINEAAQGAQLSANKMKIDFKLSSFPWIREDSYVALLSTVETEQEVKTDYDGKKDAESEAGMMAANDIFIAFSNDPVASDVNPIGEYSWVETAEVQPKVAETDVIISPQALDEKDGNEVTSNIAPVSEVIKVIATSPIAENVGRRVEGKTTQSIAFSFVGDVAHQAADIFWDPTAGVKYAESSSALALSSSSLCHAFIGSVFAGFIDVLIL